MSDLFIADRDLIFEDLGLLENLMKMELQKIMETYNSVGEMEVFKGVRL